MLDSGIGQGSAIADEVPTNIEWTGYLPQPSKPVLTVSLRVVSPMFLGGVKNGDITTASARASSVRGLVHWWLRALLGGYVKDGHVLSTSGMCALEARVLGNQERGSQISMGFFGPPGVEPPIEQGLPAVYGRIRTNRHAIQAGKELKLEIRALSWSGVGPANLQRVPEAMALAGAVWCLVTLGALGTRSRHGFGALHVTAVEGSLAEAFAKRCARSDEAITPEQVWCPPANSNEWRTFLRRGVTGAARAAATLTNAPEAEWVGRPEVRGWPCFAPGEWRLVLVDPDCPTWQRAVRWIDQRVHDHWQNSGDSGRISAALNAGAVGPIELKNLEFGAPRRWTVPGHESFNLMKLRRASPLLARPVILNQGTEGRAARYGALFLLFKSQVLDGNNATIPAPYNQQVLRPSASYPWIGEFLENLQENWPTIARM